jgi:signal transduction histidine kinase
MAEVGYWDSVRSWWARVRPPTWDLFLALVLSAVVLQPFLLLTAPLAWRRRYPIAALVIQIVGIVVADGELRPPQTAFIAILIGVYSVAAHHPSPVVSGSVLFAFGAAVTIVFGAVVPPIPDELTAFALLVPLWLAGNSARLARERLAATRIRAEQERDTAIAAERARIARELHDVVTHNVSVMVIQASAARQVLDTQLRPELGEVREAMAAVERVGQQAMDELRHMLGLLAEPGSASPPGSPPTTQPETEVPRAPQAGLDRLEALRQRLQYAGVPVVVDITGTVVELPAGVDLTAYRVVQEALTNVLRHAPGATTTVGVHYGAEELLVEVTNAPPPSPVAPATGGGRGLAGLAERVGLYDGSLTAGPLPGGGFRVAARLPLWAAA